MTEELELYAKENKVPIMQKDGILYLCNYIKEHKLERILEIGSAIGYSAMMMASVSLSIKVTTIEKDINRYEIACNYIKKYHYDKQIEIIYGDASEVDVTGKFDLIFIDAAKGKNTLFFEKFKNNLSDDGVIVTDNLGFHGLVKDEKLIMTKNQRGIVNKIKEYINFLDNNKEFVTEYIEVGDVISISKRGNTYE